MFFFPRLFVNSLSLLTIQTLYASGFEGGGGRGRKIPFFIVCNGCIGTKQVAIGKERTSCVRTFSGAVDLNLTANAFLPKRH